MGLTGLLLYTDISVPTSRADLKKNALHSKLTKLYPNNSVSPIKDITKKILPSWLYVTLRILLVLSLLLLAEVSACFALLSTFLFCTHDHIWVYFSSSMSNNVTKSCMFIFYSSILFLGEKLRIGLFVFQLYTNISVKAKIKIVLLEIGIRSNTACDSY